MKRHCKECGKINAVTQMMVPMGDGYANEMKILSEFAHQFPCRLLILDS